MATLTEIPERRVKKNSVSFPVFGKIVPQCPNRPLTVQTVGSCAGRWANVQQDREPPQTYRMSDDRVCLVTPHAPSLFRSSQQLVKTTLGCLIRDLRLSFFHVHFSGHFLFYFQLNKTLSCDLIVAQAIGPQQKIQTFPTNSTQTFHSETEKRKIFIL